MKIDAKKEKKIETDANKKKKKTSQSVLKRKSNEKKKFSAKLRAMVSKRTYNVFPWKKL